MALDLCRATSQTRSQRRLGVAAGMPLPPPIVSPAIVNNKLVLDCGRVPGAKARVQGDFSEKDKTRRTGACEWCVYYPNVHMKSLDTVITGMLVDDNVLTTKRISLCK